MQEVRFSWLAEATVVRVPLLKLGKSASLLDAKTIITNGGDEQNAVTASWPNESPKSLERY
jgi:hypothetical protein